MSVPATRRVPRTENAPAYVYHQSFDSPAEAQYTAGESKDWSADSSASYMPDEVTRDHARRMHYAAHRLHTARRPADRERWRAAYLDLRDRIVLGNRKLIYRAVRQRASARNMADDMIGDSHVVLIHAVAAFNPWLNVRFSTYAYTCLVRAMARKARRSAADRLENALSLDSLPDGEPRGRGGDAAAPASSGTFRIDDYLRDDHPLLSAREKVVLARRFSLVEGAERPTLEAVGAAVGLSKERVRQVQTAAIGKLRKVLAASPC
ncbi:MAG TPA: sigma-70 family RNA polymerase sigma factor [Gemmata sp.]|nr:sigma-70 family RNA polymerase sigma factor [Gemmata sp.]